MAKKSSEWVSARNNSHGFDLKLLRSWQIDGCPYLSGRKLPAKQLQIKIDGRTGPKLVWFFHRPTLDKIARQIKNIPTIQKIEKSGKWVCAKNNPFGFATDDLHAWRKDGCTYLSGKKLCAKQIQVKIEGPGPKLVWFYHRPTLAKIAKQIANTPTVQEVEKSGEWVCVQNNSHGFSNDNLHEWRKEGCPYLPGRKLRAKKLRVKIDGQRGLKLCWFFHRPTLDKIAPLFAARETNGKPYFKETTAWTSRETKAKWRESDTFVDQDGEWLRSGKACRYLQCKSAALYRWSTIGCSYLDGGCLRWKIRQMFDRDTKYYLISQLEEINKRQADLKPTPDKPDRILCREAALELGLTCSTLRTRAKAYGLTKHRVSVRGRDGKLTHKIAFQRVQVDALQKRIIRQDGRLIVGPPITSPAAAPAPAAPPPAAVPAPPAGQPDRGAAADAGSAAQPKRAVATIVYHGTNRLYGTHSALPVVVTIKEDDVLQCFLQLPTMDSRQLAEKAGYSEDDVGLTLRRLRKRYAGIFADAIHVPGKKSSGGYHVNITTKT